MLFGAAEQAGEGGAAKRTRSTGKVREGGREAKVSVVDGSHQDEKIMWGRGGC